MMQCSDCEHYVRGPGGQAAFTCDPFTNIKEPECLQKWQLIKLEVMVRSHQATLQLYQRLAPLQEKMIRHMEREVQDIDEADSWKYQEDEEEEDWGADDAPER